jgi:hypothetical protein
MAPRKSQINLCDHIKSVEDGYLALAAVIINQAINDYHNSPNANRKWIKEFFKSELGELLLQETKMENAIWNLLNKKVI